MIYPRFGTKRFADFLETLRPMKRCPFCNDGNASVQMQREITHGEVVYNAYVECYDCGAETSGVRFTIAGDAAIQAKELWEQRA